MISKENLSNQQIIENIKKEGLPVIIFGARIVGEVLFYACCNEGIKVECFCDNNINKTKKSLYNVPVIYAPTLKTKYKDAIFLISAADTRDAVNQLHELGFFKWYPASLLLRNFDIYQYQFNAPYDFVQYGVDTCLLCHDSYLTPDKLFLRSVDIIITERCSLKCRDCSNLTQYYKNPKNCDIKELKESIDVFCSIMDEVNEFRVIGAEPLMNKEFHLIVKRLIDEPKVKRVVIYTNGTIVPRKEQIGYLKDKKVLFIITDYGPLSRSLNALTQILQQNKIAFYVEKTQRWTDCAKIGRHYRNIKQQKEIFKNCCAKNTFTISDGKLYRCPFAANAARLMAIPDFKRDYINFLKEFQEGIKISEIKKKIRAFLLEKEFLQTCDFCNGRSFDDPYITPSIQIDKPLEYEKY